MWKMLQIEEAQDFIIATGVSHSLEEFVQVAFAELGLDCRDHTLVSDALLGHRISPTQGQCTKAERLLGWKAQPTCRKSFR